MCAGHNAGSTSDKAELWRRLSSVLLRGLVSSVHYESARSGTIRYIPFVIGAVDADQPAIARDWGRDGAGGVQAHARRCGSDTLPAWARSSLLSVLELFERILPEATLFPTYACLRASTCVHSGQIPEHIADSAELDVASSCSVSSATMGFELNSSRQWIHLRHIRRRNDFFLPTACNFINLIAASGVVGSSSARRSASGLLTETDAESTGCASGPFDEVELSSSTASAGGRGDASPSTSGIAKLLFSAGVRARSSSALGTNVLACESARDTFDETESATETVSSSADVS
jgi:hypothetical protein